MEWSRGRVHGRKTKSNCRISFLRQVGRIERRTSGHTHNPRLSLPTTRFPDRRGLPTMRRPECAGSERHFRVSFRQPFVDVVSVEVISYLKLSGSRLSSRPSAVSACGYIKNATGAPFDPGRATSCAKL